MEANIYCFICRQNWWILVFAGINGILSWTQSNIPPGCTCCWRQSTGKCDLQADFQAQRILEPSLKSDYKLPFFPNCSCLFKLWVLFLWSNACPSSFSRPVSRIVFSPCRIKNDSVLQLGGTFVWMLSHLIRHPWWTKPADFSTHQPSMEPNFVSGQNPQYLGWFHRWWNYIPILQADFTDIWGKSSYCVTRWESIKTFLSLSSIFSADIFFLVTMPFAVLSYLFYSWLVATVRKKSFK